MGTPPLPQQQVRRQRKRNIMWYNPPFTKNLEINLGKEFFKLLDKHFQENHVLRPIINRNCVKLSYSCLPNMAKIIFSHNKKVLKNENDTPEPCHCDPQTLPHWKEK